VRGPIGNIVALVVGLGLAACSPGEGPPTGPSSSPPPTTVATSHAPTTTPSPAALEPAAVVRLTGRSAAGLAELDGSLWVSHFEGSTLSEVDVSADREVRTVEVGRHPGSIRALHGRVFIAHYGVPKDDQRIGAMDPSDGSTTQSERVGPLCCELVEAGGFLWTVDVEGRLIRLDRRLAVTEAARTSANSDFHIGVVSTGDAVWVASEDSRIERFDAGTGKQTTFVEAGGGIPVASGGGLLWGARADTVWGLDVTTGEQRAEFPLEGVSEILSGAVFGPDLWLAVRDAGGAGKVLRLDTSVGDLTGEAEVGLPTNMLVVGDSLWVTDWDEHSVVRFALG